jgi:hypothetical protein|tara:strand:- start:836 stop:1495 length:660 start_codon:yes stop_codon:yes gene_type:complete
MNIIDEQYTFDINLDSNPVQVNIDQDRYYIQIDDFYSNPHLVAELANTIPITQSPRLCNGMPKNKFSGRSTTHYEFNHFTKIISSIIQSYYPRTRSNQSIQDSITDMSFMCQSICTSNLPHIEPHIDTDQHGRFAATIGLTPDAECRGGTSFYTRLGDVEDTTQEYVTDTTPKWQLDAIAPLAWNRLILYPSAYWHTAYVKPEWYTSQDNLRITQQFFI